MSNPFEPINARLNNLEALTLEVLQLLRSANQTDTDEIGGIELARQVTRLSAARIYTLVSERKLPHKKRGNRLTFRRSELLTWLDEGNRAEQKGGFEL
ncbi:helix-turn-helix domain-containing protein [Spirosoma fluviale]|uniref:Helix-turn-helix domain-containing protein n=1 Tax=Spirosoma fluviale TaxID=1597977 RepID=A0A286GV30_9BACT|nr:helix-turn-helix domain-containing protein [Spirosoma fluviale]SOD99036.1 Helix-turn-helix domain-containing protein [Spirosoma fluviale]